MYKEKIIGRKIIPIERKIMPTVRKLRFPGSNARCSAGLIK